MRFAIKALDGAYKFPVGDSLSSCYGDIGYSTWNLEQAILYDSEASAKYGLHEEGKFSEKGGAKIVLVTIQEASPHSTYYIYKNIINTSRTCDKNRRERVKNG